MEIAGITRVALQDESEGDEICARLDELARVKGARRARLAGQLAERLEGFMGIEKDMLIQGFRNLAESAATNV